MTENEDHIFDKILKDKLSGYKEEVPDFLWQRINKKGNTFFNLIKNPYIVLSGMVILVMIVIGFIIFRNNKTTKTIKSHLLVTKQIKNTQVNIVKENNFKSQAIIKPFQNIQPVKENVKKQTKPDMDKNIQKRSKEPIKTDKLAGNNNSTESPISSTPVKNNNTISQTSSTPVKVNNNKNTNSQSKAVLNGNIEQKPSMPVKADQGNSNTQSTETVKSSITVKNNNIQQVNNNIAINTETINTPIPIKNNNDILEADKIISIKKDINEDIIPLNTQQPNSFESNKNINKIDSVKKEVNNIQFKPNKTDSITHDILINTNTKSTKSKKHSFLEIAYSPEFITKINKAVTSDMANYKLLLDKLSGINYSWSAGIRYSYYFNSFFDINTGIIYNQISEKLYGQIKPEVTTINYSLGTIISPFGPPRKVILTDTIRIPAKTISKNNSFTYVKIPLQVGVNFKVSKIQFNVHLGINYFYSLIQQGAYIDPVSLVQTDFQKGKTNPYSKISGLDISGRLNAYFTLTDYLKFLIGVDYSRNMTPVNSTNYNFKQYYSVTGLNIGLSYKLH